MTESAPPRPRIRPGRPAFWTLFVVVVGIVAVIKLWPASLGERQDAAVELCKNEVDTVEPTPGRKVWQESSFQVDGDEVLTVWGTYATKDLGDRRFSCEVEDGKITSSQMWPGK